MRNGETRQVHGLRGCVTGSHTLLQLGLHTQPVPAQGGVGPFCLPGPVEVDGFMRSLCGNLKDPEYPRPLGGGWGGRKQIWRTSPP